MPRANKIFTLDTNVILHDSSCIYQFEEHDIVLPITVLEELQGGQRAGPLVPEALKATRKGGTVVLGGIHMSNIPTMPYKILWGERAVRSVANLTRQDAAEFLDLTARCPIETTVEAMPLDQANEALRRLRAGPGGRLPP